MIYDVEQVRHLCFCVEICALVFLNFYTCFYVETCYDTKYILFVNWCCIYECVMWCVLEHMHQLSNIRVPKYMKWWNVWNNIDGIHWRPSKDVLQWNGRPLMDGCTKPISGSVSMRWSRLPYMETTKGRLGLVSGAHFPLTDEHL